MISGFLKVLIILCNISLSFPSAKLISYPDFKSAYKAVEKGECDCVILPIENSFNGDVGNVLDLAFLGLFILMVFMKLT